MRLAPGLVRMLDVAFVSGQRLPRQRVPREPIAELVPDLALEILSKGDTRREMARKLAEYFTSGVRLAWLVEPTKRTVRVYTSSQSSHLVRESGKLDGGDVLPVFQIAVRDWFRRAESCSQPQNCESEKQRERIGFKMFARSLFDPQRKRVRRLSPQSRQRPRLL